MIEIRAVTTDEEYEVYAATQRRIFPGAPSLDEFRHRERTWAAFHAIAYLDGARRAPASPASSRAQRRSRT